jgi:hypothetical protein
VPGDTATGELCTLCHGEFVQSASRLVAPQVPAAQACSSCHAGEESADPPTDHVGRSVATCSLCHQTRTLVAQPVPHTVEGWQQCSFCHGEGRLAPVEGGHQELPDNECLSCHDAVRDPPSMPEFMLDYSAARGGCTSCHGEGLLAPLPADDAERDVATCALCHSATATREAAPPVPHSLTPLTLGGHPAPGD